MFRLKGGLRTQRGKSRRTTIAFIFVDQNQTMTAPVQIQFAGKWRGTGHESGKWGGRGLHSWALFKGRLMAKS